MEGRPSGSVVDLQTAPRLENVVNKSVNCGGLG
jgi:hypothetical protein